MHFTGVKMYYKGQCKTHIRKQEGSGEHRRSVVHTSNEQYFDYQVENRNLADVKLMDKTKI